MKFGGYDVFRFLTFVALCRLMTIAVMIFFALLRLLLMITFVAYDFCCLMTFVGYDVCRLMTFVASDVCQLWCLSPYFSCRLCHLLHYDVCHQFWCLSLIGFVAVSFLSILLMAKSTFIKLVSKLLYANYPYFLGCSYFA